MMTWDGLASPACFKSFKPALGLVPTSLSELSILDVAALHRSSLENSWKTTVGEALEGFVSNLGARDLAMVASLTVRDGVALLAYAVYQPQMESVDQVTDAALAVATNVLRALFGSTGRAPPLVFPAEDLTSRVVGADPLLRELLGGHGGIPE